MFLELEDLAHRLTDESSDVRQEACYLLGKLENHSSANLLAKAMIDPDPRVRILARKSLDRLKMLGITPDPTLIPKAPPLVLTRQTYQQLMGTQNEDNHVPISSTNNDHHEVHSHSTQSSAVPKPPPTSPPPHQETQLPPAQPPKAAFTRHQEVKPEMADQLPQEDNLPSEIPSTSSVLPIRLTLSPRTKTPEQEKILQPEVVAKAPPHPKAEKAPSSTPNFSGRLTFSPISHETIADQQPLQKHTPSDRPKPHAEPAIVEKSEPLKVEQPKPPVKPPIVVKKPEPGKIEQPKPPAKPPIVVKKPEPGKVEHSKPPEKPPIVAKKPESVKEELERAPSTSSKTTSINTVPKGLSEHPKWWSLIKKKDGEFVKLFESRTPNEKIEILSQMELYPPFSKWAIELCDLFEKEKDVFVLSKLLKVFGKHHGPGAAGFLAPFLEHDDERIISNCLEGLAAAGGPKDLENIAAFLDHPEARIKSTAAQALWSINPQAAYPVVQKLAKSLKVWERDAAKFALQTCPLEESKALLEELESTIPKVVEKLDPLSEEQAQNWTSRLGILGKILNFPVEVGLEKPLPLWLFVVLIAFSLIFFFYIALPFFEWLLPAPANP